MPPELKKFYEWLSRRRKLMGVQWKQVYSLANLSKTTVTDVVRHDRGNTNNRDRVAIAFGFYNWADLQRAYRSGTSPDEKLPKLMRKSDVLSPARLAEQLVHFSGTGAEIYREQVFQHLPPKAVAEIAEVFTKRLARYAKGG